MCADMSGGGGTKNSDLQTLDGPQTFKATSKNKKGPLHHSYDLGCEKGILCNLFLPLALYKLREFKQNSRGKQGRLIRKTKSALEYMYLK